MDDAYINIKQNTIRKPKSAVFIGSVDQRIDLELLNDTASLLFDWRIDVIGPLNRTWPGRASNLQWLPPVSRKNVPEVLSRYQVGLIPFREVSGGIRYVEQPLKFLEYIGSGIGVASTDVGALRAGMGDWASYGNTPEHFAEAIRIEAISANRRSFASCQNLIKKNSWGNVSRIVNERLKNLINFKTIVS